MEKQKKVKMPRLFPFNALLSESKIIPDMRKTMIPLEKPDRKDLIKDACPHIYLYVQYFKLPNSNQESCRKGIVGLVPVDNKNQILKHENIISENVDSLICHIEKTGVTLQPVHAFHKEENKLLHELCEGDIDLLADFTDQELVRNELYKITNSEKSQQLRDFYNEKAVYIADGHHRFHAHQKLSNSSANWNKYLLMYLTDLTICPETILPIHRLLKLKDFKKNEFLTKLSEFFIVTPCELEDIQTEIEGYKYHFGLYIKNKSLVLKLKDDLENQISWPFPDTVKQLDLTVLHFYVIQETAGIKGYTQKDSKEIKFSSIFTDAVTAVDKGEADVCLICNPVAINEIIEVAESGYILPQKSTSFYPKINSGLIFASAS